MRTIHPMRQFTKLFAFLSVGLVTSLATGTTPDRERLKLVELDVSGRPLASPLAKHLDVEKTRGRAVAFVFGEVTGTSCSRHGCASSYRAARFDVVETREDKCGAVHYAAESERAEGRTEKLEAISHAADRCQTAKVRWTIVLIVPGEEKRSFRAE